MIKPRIWLKRGRKRMKFILMDGPVPQKNEVCTIRGDEWVVTKVEMTEVLASFATENGTLKQVYP
jgi:hypothetical protein